MEINEKKKKKITFHVLTHFVNVLRSQNPAKRTTILKKNLDCLIREGFSITTDNGYSVIIKKEKNTYQVTIEKFDFQCAMFLKSSDEIRRAHANYDGEDEPILLARFNSRIVQDDPAFEIYLQTVDTVRNELNYPLEVEEII